MYIASARCDPAIPDLATRSDLGKSNQYAYISIAPVEHGRICSIVYDITHPARSTRWSLALRIVSEPGSLEEMWMVKIQCERVDAMFMGV